ncbi:MAG TPA: S1/P1 nuclease [Terriglobales bacterium]|nr:S1/P1 nuclease [Terriglobales bacterium]
MKLKALCCSFVLLLVSASSTPAHAWGCEGHQIVALIAMKHLQPQVAGQVNAILATAPVNSALRRYCRNLGLPPIADAATWADDYRAEQPDTGPLHYVNIPLNVTRDKYDVSQMCQSGCVIDAINKYVQQLKTSKDAAARGDALRFVIHLVGDIHQPLHDEDNSDEGGNCVPVAFEDEAPRLTSPQREDYFPNLHSVWDTGLLESLLDDHDMTVEEFADFIDIRYHSRAPRWNVGQPIDWAWEGHDAAVTAYRALPAFIPREPGNKVSSCADNHIGKRMADLHIDLGARYDDVSHPIVEEQLAKAGVRLATLLNSALGSGR